MTKCNNINPDILKWARETAGFKIDQVQKSFKNISAWENGTKYPTYIQLEELSDKYKRPLVLFFFPQVPQEESIEKSFRTIPSIQQKAIPPSVRFVLREGKILQMNLLELCNEKNPYEDQLITKKIKIEKNINVKDLAKEVRSFLSVDIVKQKQWSSSKEAFDYWRKLLTQKGIFVFKNAFRSDDYSGFCLYDKTFPIICVNNTSTETRQIFTLFHELAHLLYQGSHIDFAFRDQYLKHLDGDDKKIEIFCNKFVAEFLVPSNDLKNEIKKYFSHNPSHIEGVNAIKNITESLAKSYKVSREVILRKFLDKKQITKTEYRNFIEKIQKEFQEQSNQKAKKKSGADYYNTRISYLGKPYLNLVFNRYLNKRISIDQTAEYLFMKVKSVENLEANY